MQSDPFETLFSFSCATEGCKNFKVSHLYCKSRKISGGKFSLGVLLLSKKLQRIANLQHFLHEEFFLRYDFW